MSSIDQYLIPKALKKTSKYSEQDFEQVRYLHKRGLAIRQIARDTGMSRRMIQFTVFPERKDLAKVNFAKRQKDGRYRYSTETQSKMVAEVRSRKRKLVEKLIKKQDENI